MEKQNSYLLCMLNRYPTKDDLRSPDGDIFKPGDIWIDLEESTRYKLYSIDYGKAVWVIEAKPGEPKDEDKYSI